MPSTVHAFHVTAETYPPSTLDPDEVRDAIVNALEAIGYRATVELEVTSHGDDAINHVIPAPPLTEAEYERDKSGDPR